MKQLLEHLDLEITAQIVVNNVPVYSVDGRAKGKEMWIQWTDLGGRRWEGHVDMSGVEIPPELEVGVAFLHLKVLHPIFIPPMRRNRGR